MKLSHDQKKLIASYNHPETLAVITSYPNRGELYSAGKSGVASYTKNVIKNIGHKTIILCEYDHEPMIYEEENTLVIRCFRIGSLSMYRDISTVLLSCPLVKKLLVQYDFSLYGNIIINGLMLPFLGIVKLLGYHTTVTLHHVVTDIRKLSGHVGIGNSRYDQMKAAVYNMIFFLFYQYLDAVTSTIIVLEEELKTKLSMYIKHTEKIITIPHGVDTKVTLRDKAKARELLKLPKHKFVILFFGYVNWFKGADLFAEYFKHTHTLLGKGVTCIMAGGESPTLKKHGYYQTFYKHVTNTVKNSDHLKLTGYVPQKKLELYFSACDLVVMPYRHFMTASGVLSLIFSYKKPFIISKELESILQSSDIKTASEKIGFNPDDAAFQLNKKSCIRATEKILANGLKEKMTKLGALVSESRSYKTIGQLYGDVLFTPSYKLTSTTNLGYTS